MATAGQLKPAVKLQGSVRSSFHGLTQAFQSLSMSPQQGRTLKLAVQASRVCDLTGKKANNGYNVTFSHKRNHKLQHVNLQDKKVYWPEGQRWVKLRLSTKALKTIEKKGLQVMAKEAGLDLSKLPYVDARPARTEWLAKQGAAKPPMAKNPRRMKNPEKLAASKKTPLVAEFVAGGKILYRRAEQGEY